MLPVSRLNSLLHCQIRQAEVFNENMLGGFVVRDGAVEVPLQPIGESKLSQLSRGSQRAGLPAKFLV